MASTTKFTRTKEQYVETLREREPQSSPADMMAYTLGAIRYIARRDEHAELTAILDALDEVMGW